MNKQLAKKGTTLNKNMTNMESLSLTYLQSTSARITSCTSNYIKTNELSCEILDIPINCPDPATINYTGTMYFDVTTNTLFISDGTKKANNIDYNWYSVTLNHVP